MKYLKFLARILSVINLQYLLGKDIVSNEMTDIMERYNGDEIDNYWKRF